MNHPVHRVVDLEAIGDHMLQVESRTPAARRREAAHAAR